MKWKIFVSLMLFLTMISVVHAAVITSCPATITENSVLSGNINTTGNCITFGADFVELDCQDYTISGDGTGLAINAENKMGIAIKNCIVDNFQYGIRLTEVNNATVDLNTVTTSGWGIHLSGTNSSLISLNDVTTTSDHAIYLEADSVMGTASNNNNLIGNTALYDGTSLYNAIAIGGNNNWLYNNVGTANGVRAGILVTGDFNILEINTGQGNGGIKLSGANDCSLYGDIGVSTGSDAGIYVAEESSNNYLRSVNGQGVQTGISFSTAGNGNTLLNSEALGGTRFGLILDSAYNTFINTSIETNSGIVLRLTYDDASYNTFDNTRLVINNGATWIWSYVSTGAQDNLFTNTVFETADGSIKTLSQFELPAPFNLSRDALDITFNKAYLETGGIYSFLSLPSIIKLNGITFNDPEPIVDFNDDDVFEDCAPSICTELSFIGDVYKYRVEHFTAFSSKEKPVTGCPVTITQDTTLTTNLNANGDCVTFGADNIVLDCAGHLIESDGTGVGINTNSKSGITIKNCIVSNFATDILFSGSNNGLVQNTNVMNSDNELSIQNSDNNVFEQVLFYKDANYNQGTWFSTDGASTGNTFEDIDFQKASEGIINVIPLVTASALTTVDVNNLNIYDKIAYLNSGELGFLDVYSILTFYGITFTDPKPVVDTRDRGRFKDCDSSICTEISYDSGVYKYSVEHFTMYSGKEGAGGGEKPPKKPKSIKTKKIKIS